MWCGILQCDPWSWLCCMEIGECALSRPARVSHSELSPFRAAPGADIPGVDQLAHQECLKVTVTDVSASRRPRASSFLPQAGDPAQCRHGHHPAAATEADDAGPAHLQCCDHPRPRPHLYLPPAACQPHPHPHPVLPFSGEFQTPFRHGTTALPFLSQCHPKLLCCPFCLAVGPSLSQTVLLKEGSPRSCGHGAKQQSPQTKVPRQLGRGMSRLSGVGSLMPLEGPICS